VKTVYRQAARDDVVRQFRYYLVDQKVPRVATRFKDAVRATVESLRRYPLIGARYQSHDSQLSALRSWPVAGFERIRIFYLIEGNELHVVRILHGSRDISRILRREEAP
jgi:toxin ParE1/3/4